MPVDQSILNKKSSNKEDSNKKNTNKKNDNQKHFAETKDLFDTHDILISDIRESRNNQSIIPESEQLNPVGHVNDKKTEVIVSNKTILEAASAYKDKKVCVLNPGSATCAGGGVTDGASGQEESLCRASTLYKNIAYDVCFKSFYRPHKLKKEPLHTDDIIYSPGVTVLRRDTEDTELAKLLPEEEWYKVDFITCSAPNLRKVPESKYHKDGMTGVTISKADLQKLLEKRFERIFQVAALNQNQVLIMGPFGCGPFHNPNSVVAKAAKTVIDKCGGWFETIEFAIESPNNRTGNLEAFAKEFDHVLYEQLKNQKELRKEKKETE